MPQEKFIEIPKKVLIRGKKFVDQSVNSHVPVTRVLRHLIGLRTVRLTGTAVQRTVR